MIAYSIFFKYTFIYLYIKDSIIQIINEKDIYQFLTENRIRQKYIFRCQKLNISFAQLQYQGRSLFNQKKLEVGTTDKIQVLNSIKKYFKDFLNKNIISV